MVSLGDERYKDAFERPRSRSQETAPLLTSINGQSALAGQPLSSTNTNHSTLHPVKRNKKRLRVIASTVITILLLCGYEAMLFVPAFKLGTHFLDSQKAPFAFLCILHAAVSMALAGLYAYGERCHHKSRLLGYLKFYRDTQLLRRIPTVSMFVGNAGLLIFASVWSNNNEATINRRNLIQILVSIEMAVCIPTAIIYLVKVVRFNQSDAPPDAYHEFQTNGNTTINSDFDIDASVDVDELLDRQSDMLKYMRQYTANLQAEIFVLQNQLRLMR